MIAPVVVMKRPDKPPSPRPQREAAKKLGGIAVGVICVIFLCVHWLGGGGDSTTASVPISSVSFVDFDSKFCIHSRLTDVQKDQQIAGLKGQRVRWEGIVSYVSDGSVGVKHKATTATYDVLLRVPSEERSKLVSLNTGDLVTYEGTIEDYGTLLPHSLSDGHIVSSKPMSSGDQLVFLAKAETAVLERIGGKSDD